MKTLHRLFVGLLCGAALSLIAILLFTITVSTAHWIKIDSIPNTLTVTNATPTAIDDIVITVRTRMLLHSRIAPGGVTNVVYQPIDDSAYTVLVTRNNRLQTNVVGYITTSLIANDTLLIGRDTVAVTMNTNVSLRRSVLSLFY